MDYNELGQLMLKKLHMSVDTSYVQDIDYLYDIRGWLKSINNFKDTTFRKLYAQQMDYFANGNISSVKWKNTQLNTHYFIEPTNSRKYNFTYDALNRMEDAVYSEFNPQDAEVTSRGGYFNEDPLYDLNGNIVRLKRWGSTDSLGTQGGMIDDLIYTYRDNSNQLSRVGDITHSVVTHNKHVKDMYAADYSYDQNGNATFILHKTAFIAYNHLNLPDTISNTQGTISYLYDGLGNKLKKNFTDAQSNGFDSYYQGSVLLTGGKVIVMNGEGRSVKNGASWDYEYDLKDHLGNTRISFAADSALVVPLQTKDYYPFGLEMVDSIANNADATKYLYNGKELQDEAGLDFYDYGARFYDPVVGRFNSVDPAADGYNYISPYVYCANNPIAYIDPTGMYIEEGSQKEWKRLKSDVTSQRDYLQKRLDKLTAKAEAKGWSSEKLSRRTGGMEESIESLNGTLNVMGALEDVNNSQGYSLSHTEEGKKGGVTLNTETNIIDIKFGSSNTANFVHEVTHAGQFESRWGHIAFDTKNGKTLAQDVYDEVQAYRAQYAYDPYSVSNLTSTSRINSMHDILPQWVQGLAGGNYYVPGGEANTGISPVYINSTGADLMRAYPHLSYPNNYIMKTDYSNLYLKK